MERWQALLGGELLAFSAAVARRAETLRASDWGIGPEDAKGYIEERYLRGIPADERQALRALVTLSEFELGLPAEVTDSDLAQCLSRGLVLKTGHGGGGRIGHGAP